MANFGKIVTEITENIGKGFSHMGGAFKGAFDTSTGMLSWIVKPIKWMAHVAMNIAAAPFRAVAWMFGTKAGGALGAATVAVGTPIAAGVGIHAWNKHKEHNRQQAREEIAATQAELGAGNPTSNYAAIEEAKRQQALQQGSSLSA